MEFRHRLIQLRTAAELTQEQISDVLGITRSAYAYYETGKSTPNLPMLEKLGRIYNMDLNELTGTGSSKRLHDETQTPYFAQDEMAYFNTLNAQEKKLVLFYRSLEDKQGFLRYLTEFQEDANDTSGSSSDLGEG